MSKADEAADAVVLAHGPAAVAGLTLDALRALVAGDRQQAARLVAEAAGMFTAGHLPGVVPGGAWPGMAESPAGIMAASFPANAGLGEAVMRKALTLAEMARNAELRKG